MVEKIKSGFFKVKAYWRKPPKGYDVSYKEITSYTVGYMSLNFLGVITFYTTVVATSLMLVSYFELSAGMIWIFSIVSAAVILLRSPLLSMIIDNNKSKKGKFKPFILVSSIGAAVFLCLIPFVPKSWTGISLFSFNLPAIPVMGINEPSKIVFSLAVLVLFVLLQAGLAFHTLLCQALAGIEQTISTVAQERTNIAAVKNLASNFPSSIINMVVPIFVASVFANKGGYKSVDLYRWLFPICAVFAIVCGLFMVKGVKERSVVNKKFVAKASFWQSAKMLSKNKYFWIIIIFNMIVTLRALTNISEWIKQYSFTDSKSQALVGFYCASVMQLPLVLGNIIGPVLVKKFGKGRLVLFSAIGFVAMAGLQLILYKNAIAVLAVLFLQQLFSGFNYITAVMASDALDYQQWKTGKRLEGFWQNYDKLITTIIAVFTGMLLPIFLTFGGVNFSDNLDVALSDETLRNNSYKYQTLLGFIAAIVCVIPLIFYDLTEAKHAKIVKVLKIRAAVENFNDKELQDIDVLNVKEIKAAAEETQDKFVLDEIEKHTVIDEIMTFYDEAFLRTEEKKKKEEEEEMARKAELEEKRKKAELEKNERRKK